jgi:predicted dehydrogenase
MHVFAEKPLAADLEQARELCVLAKENGIVHGIDFMFPEIAEWRKAKEMLAAEELGPCRHVAVDWTWLSGDLRHDRSTWRTDVAAGGGVLSLHFSHGLHYLEHFAGKITDVACLFSHSPRSRNGGEVGVDMLLTFPDSVTGSVHVSCNSPGRVAHRLVFQCERGVIVLENSDAVVDNFSVRTYSESGEQLVAVEADTGQPGEDERAKIVRRVAERFVEACAGKGHASPSFEDGLRAHELIELARRNAVPR